MLQGRAVRRWRAWIAMMRREPSGAERIALSSQPPIMEIMPISARRRDGGCGRLGASCRRLPPHHEHAVQRSAPAAASIIANMPAKKSSRSHSTLCRQTGKGRTERRERAAGVRAAGSDGDGVLPAPHRQPS